MSHNLLNELRQITEEEQTLLENQLEIRRDIYTSQSHFVIESEKFLSSDKMIMIRKHPRFVVFPKHKHNYIEMNYIFHGNLHQKVGNKEIDLKKGEILLLNQHIEHELEECGKEDIIINFIIHPHFFDFIFSYLSSDNIISDFLISSLYNNTQKGQFLYFSVSDIENIQELIERMIKEFMNPTLLSNSTIKLYMGLLMIELVKHSDKLAMNQHQTHTQQFIIQALKYIDENYTNATLSELAEELHIPHYTLSKQIKSETGYTFKELLQEKRLSKAKELLESTTLSVSSIVEQVGYDNISYFYRIFKNKYGYTPKKFRDR